MADLKFGSETPALGKIKVGGDDVSKIYKGSDQVWPSDPGSYLVQICESTQTTRITAKQYWDNSVVPAVLIDIPSVIADNKVLKISDNAALKGAFCVEIISYDASIAATNNYYFVNDIYSSCEECSPTPIGPIGPGPTPIGPGPTPIGPVDPPEFYSGLIYNTTLDRCSYDDFQITLSATEVYNQSGALIDAPRTYTAGDIIMGSTTPGGARSCIQITGTTVNSSTTPYYIDIGFNNGLPALSCQQCIGN